MCPRPVVVVDVLRQDLAKMPFADHDNVVKAFPSNRANHPLGIRVLPRRAGRDDRLPDVQRVPSTYWSDRLTPPGASIRDDAHRRVALPPPGPASVAAHS